MTAFSSRAPVSPFRRHILNLTAMLLLATGVGCKFQAGSANKDKKKGEAADKTKDERKEEAVPVELGTVTRGPIEEVIKASNHLEAEQEVKVYSRAANRVIELLAEEGDKVAKDQVLVRLQNDDQQNAYDKALSQYNQALANFRRTEKMFTDELVSQREYDDGKYSVEQLKLTLNEAKRQLDFTEIKAPIAGVITARLVRLGDQVNAGAHLFDIIDFESIVARVYVPEKSLPSLAIGNPARITAQSLKGQVFNGSIKRIAPVVDSTSGTVKVTLAVQGDGKLLPGMFVDAEIIVSTHPDALLISKRSIVYDSDQMFVFRLGESNRVERALVEPALTDKDHVEPVGGFKEGDQVVIAGQTGLKDGALVSLPGQEPDADKESTAADGSATTNSPPDAGVSG